MCVCVVKNMSLSVSFRDDGIHALPFLRASARASRATANIVVAIVVGDKTSSCFLLLLLSLSLSLFFSLLRRERSRQTFSISVAFTQNDGRDIVERRTRIIFFVDDMVLVGVDKCFAL